MELASRNCWPGLMIATGLIALFAASATVSAEEAPVPTPTFARDIRPLLQQYCFRCHGGPKVKGDVNLSPFSDERSVLQDMKLWRTVGLKLRDRDMPPEGKPQPDEIERQRIINWIHSTLSTASIKVKDPGRVTIHRLNREEYNNTIRDLLGVDSHPADLFPADGAGGEGFDNDADTLFIPPILMEQYLKAAGDVLKQADPKRLFIVTPNASLPKRDAARQIIEHFAKRAFRRPVSGDEVGELLRLFDKADAQGESFEDSVRLALKGVLVSPSFLFRLERDQNTSEPYRISDFELASRLSYFIWSSMPDEELFGLASQNKLHDPQVLEEQVRRMLKDPRSRALAEQFGTEWLQIRDLKTTIQPDRRRFPEYTPAVRDAMYDEAVAFVDSVFRDNRNLLTLLDADYIFVNHDLAKLYGIDGIKGQEMQRVELKDGKRGGVLSMGAVLTVTSYPLRTSPVLRGKWVLEAILGAPPAPPPPTAGQLPADDHKFGGLTLRQRLEEHRKNPQCASCHNRMDPLGFGLENFDAVGRWRDKQNDHPIDSEGVLLTGEKFNGPAELKEVILKKYKHEFIRNLSEKMLAYALGRGLEYYDHPAVAKIAEAVEKDDCQSSRLVLEVVKSFPFQYRRNAPMDEQEAKADE